MINIHIVGQGSLGSTIALEIAKRALATSMPLKVNIYDYDIVESRNLVAQAFDPTDLGETKVNAMLKKLSSYDIIETKGFNEKITKENVKELLLTEGYSVVIDCVDNLPTRELLWQYGVVNNIPILHLGMSTSGQGNVSWNFGSVDTFPLSPKNLSQKQRKAVLESSEGESLPPCELNSLRGLILCTCQAGLDSLFTFLGKDMNNDFEDVEIEDYEKDAVLSSWSTSTRSFRPILESVSVERWDPKNEVMI